MTAELWLAIPWWLIPAWFGLWALVVLEHRYLAPRITRWRHRRHDPWARLGRRL